MLLRDVVRGRTPESAAKPCGKDEISVKVGLRLIKLTGSKSSEAVKFLRHGIASLRARTRDAAVPGLGAALGLWTMSRLGPGCESLGKDHRSKASNLVCVGAARG